MLSQLKRDHLRPVQLSDGRRVYQMKPTFLRQPVPPDSQYKGLRGRSLFWIALPYFELAKYSDPGSSVVAGGALPVPAKTLLQTQFAHVEKQRDLKQAACRSGDNGRRELCLHVGQLWCLVLDNCELGFPDR